MALTRRHAIGAVALAFILSGCKNPVPAGRESYIGLWSEPNMQLLITKDGDVRYARRRGSSNSEVNGPLKRFVEDNFEVGFGPFSTTFIVSRPPYFEDGKWRMTVDGVNLVKVENSGV